MRIGKGAGVIAASFVVAFLLAAIPLPTWAASWRPAWVVMVLIYWCLAAPQKVGVGVAWVLGLLLDALKGTLLGQHAAGLAIVAFITIRLHQRVRLFPLLQQALFVGALLSLYTFLMLWVRGILGLRPEHAVFWLPVLTSMVLWPWLFIILRDIGRKGRVF